MKIIRITTEQKDKQLRLELATLLEDYFSEVNGDTYIGNEFKCYSAINTIIENDSAIYTLHDDEEMIGFLIAYISDQYGLLQPYVVCEYMYVIPSKRSSIATMWLFYMLGKICVDYGYDGVGTTYLSSANIDNNKKMEGEPTATVYRFPLSTVTKHFNKYKRRIEK